MLELNNIYNMDCLKGLQLMDDETVDLTITSPPYDNLRTYQGHSVFDFEGIANELYRVTKKGGVVVWVVADQTVNGSETGTSFRQALFFKEIGFNIHDTMIYRKENYVPLTHNRYEQEWEYMFVFSKGKPKTFNPIRIPCKYAGTETWGKSSFHKTNDSGLVKSDEKKIIGDTKQHGNIFSYRTGSTQNKGKKHPAIFPEQLVLDNLNSWSNEGDTILDPFMGSGTTAKCSAETNRNYIGFEINEDYYKEAKKQLENVQIKLI